MTTLLARPAEGNLWSSMPGWGIVADLTPPELVAARHLKVLRKIIGAGLALVIVLCAAGYTFAFLKHSSASDSVDAADGRTIELTVQQGKYSNVTRIQAMTRTVDSQIAGLMANDVDMAGLLDNLRGALPGSMSLTSITVSISGAAAGTDTAPTLDTSGRPTIGTVTLTGTSQALADLADYISALGSLPGVVNVVPSTNAAGSAGAAQWNVALQITDKLYTHRYAAVGQSGGNR